MSKEHILFGIKTFFLMTSSNEKDSFMQKMENLIESGLSI